MRLRLQPARLDARGVLTVCPDGEAAVVLTAHAPYRARRLCDGRVVVLPALLRTAGTWRAWRASGASLGAWLERH